MGKNRLNESLHVWKALANTIVKQAYPEELVIHLDDWNLCLDYISPMSKGLDATGPYFHHTYAKIRPFPLPIPLPRPARVDISATRLLPEMTDNGDD